MVEALRALGEWGFIGLKVKLDLADKTSLFTLEEEVDHNVICSLQQSIFDSDHLPNFRCHYVLEHVMYLGFLGGKAAS